jgi:prepilin peptidase CpaA
VICIRVQPDGDSPCRGSYLYYTHMVQNLFLFGAVLVACVGGISDLHSARIPNWLTYNAIVSGLVLRLAVLGWSGLGSGSFAVLVAGGIFFLLFMIGAMGGGDLKLMVSVAAWAGSEHFLFVLIAAALAGGLLAVGYIIFGQGIRSTVRNIVDLICFRLTFGFIPHPELNVCQPGTLRVPFGVAIAMGTLLCTANVIWWR